MGFYYTYLDPFAPAITEAVKCLCNILLKNQDLTPLYASLGCLKGLARRLGLCHQMELPYDVSYFDLRLLFLITACGQAER